MLKQCSPYCIHASARLTRRLRRLRPLRIPLSGSNQRSIINIGNHDRAVTPAAAPCPPAAIGQAGTLPLDGGRRYPTGKDLVWLPGGTFVSRVAVWHNGLVC